jgi:hypothetical protein
MYYSLIVHVLLGKQNCTVLLKFAKMLIFGCHFEHAIHGTMLYIDIGFMYSRSAPEGPENIIGGQQLFHQQGSMLLCTMCRESIPVHGFNFREIGNGNLNSQEFPFPGKPHKLSSVWRKWALTLDCPTSPGY